MSTTVEVKLCSGVRKGIEKIDTLSLPELEGNVINIKLYPSSISNGGVIINVSLLREDWELFEADQHTPTITWSEVDYFSVVGNSVFVVTDHDDFFYGLTRIEVPNPPACDVKTILLTGSKSGDFYQWPAHIISDGLIGSEPTNLPYITYANLIPGELLWANFLFVNSSNFSSYTSGYKAPGITGGRILQVKWFIKDILKIYLVDCEGYYQWLLNSQCTELQVGQWVFIGYWGESDTEDTEDAVGEISYGKEYDTYNCFILPINIQGYGLPGFTFNTSKQYSNIKFYTAYLTGFSGNKATILKGEDYIDAGFYCAGPGIDPTSGHQFAVGDLVVVMTYMNNRTIIGKWGGTCMPVFIDFMGNSVLVGPDIVLDEPTLPIGLASQMFYKDGSNGVSLGLPLDKFVSDGVNQYRLYVLIYTSGMLPKTGLMDYKTTLLIYTYIGNSGTLTELNKIIDGGDNLPNPLPNGGVLVPDSGGSFIGNRISGCKTKAAVINAWFYQYSYYASLKDPFTEEVRSRLVLVSVVVSDLWEYDIYGEFLSATKNYATYTTTTVVYDDSVMHTTITGSIPYGGMYTLSEIFVPFLATASASYFYTETYVDVDKRHREFLSGYHNLTYYGPNGIIISEYSLNDTMQYVLQDYVWDNFGAIAYWGVRNYFYGSGRAAGASGFIPAYKIFENLAPPDEFMTMCYSMESFLTEGASFIGTTGRSFFSNNTSSSQFLAHSRKTGASLNGTTYSSLNPSISFTVPDGANWFGYTIGETLYFRLNPHPQIV